MAFLPPGCQFSPSEELLVGYYLANKNSNEVLDFNGADLIKELDLYDHNPFELPDTACFSYGYQGIKRHWYCYTVRVAEEIRRARSGFWLKRGEVHNVSSGAGNVVLGTRTRFIFHIGNTGRENSTKTNLIMYEYALANNPLAPFVLCRVFDRSAEISMSSCITGGDSSVERNKEVSHNPLLSAGEQEDRRAVTAPRSVGPQGTQQERLFGLPNDGAFFIEAMTPDQFSLSILKEDFIAIDDLP